MKAAVIKVAKSPAGALVVGFLTRELLAAAGWTTKTVVKGTIRHSIKLQRTIKDLVNEAKHEINTLAEEATEELDDVEGNLVGSDHDGDAAGGSEAPAT
ncbi:hypothetical protein ENSA5_54030 [Enhygromyxa salina]|uniref:Uncharacterized protein n=1 Tax=Enhygromyxa salina TaxID=215803 RepID=A0A2S9XFK2_9BACT|nr:hypothetical protein [Enhygromyxa salina]PRP91643.1 hypothetical protein ENSA5_54030 [Enhygromyxa salina]